MQLKPVSVALVGMGIFAIGAIPRSQAAVAQVTVSAQGGSVSAAGGTIVIAHVPVQVGSAAPSFFDVTITLTGTSVGGTPSGVKVTGKSVASQLINTDEFQQGTYKDAAGNTYSVTGPGIGPDGATAWSLTFLSQGPNFPCTLQSISWYTDTGPNNPEAGRVQAAGITTTAYSFGLSGGSNCDANPFSNGALIGVAHTGSGISLTSFSSFTTNKPTDNGSPTSTWTLTPQ
jgi:hypothetical protein